MALPMALGSMPFGVIAVALRHENSSPRVLRTLFPLMGVGSTALRSVHEPGFTAFRLLTPQCRLYPLPVRRASVLPPASFRLPVTRAALAVQLTLPRVGCVEDFHLQESAPCRAHHEKAAEGDSLGCR